MPTYTLFVDVSGHSGGAVLSGGEIWREVSLFGPVKMEMKRYHRGYLNAGLLYPLSFAYFIPSGMTVGGWRSSLLQPTTVFH